MRIILWWSGGVTSAVACKLAIDIYGVENCEAIMLDTKNEHEDTYRFKKDCEKWYGLEIKTLSAIGSEYKSIQDVWIKHKSLNVATGAICSYKLKRVVREKWEKENEYTHQVFGFEFDKKEFNRANSLKLNHPQTKPIFPLLMFGYEKNECVDFLKKANIKIPTPYKWGLKNNNCLGTGCVQGGIGYWQKIKREHNGLFERMAEMEHKLTDLKDSPVTMLKDQSKEAKETGNQLVFLKKHKNYPQLKCLDDMKGREPEPLQECSTGLCGLNELNKVSKTNLELNFEEQTK